MKRFAMVAILMALVGCSSNSLVMVIDGKVYQQELPSEVTFPLVIEELPAEIEKAEVEKVEVKAETEAEGEQAVVEPTFPLVMTSKSSERAFRLSTLEANQKYKARGGILANVSWW